MKPESTLARFLRAMTGKSAPEAKAEEVIEDVVAENVGVDLMASDLATVQAEFEKFKNDTATLFEDLNAKLEAATAAKNLAEEKLASFIAAAATEKRLAREKTVAGVVGDKQAVEFMARCGDLPDEQFSAVLGVISASYASESRSKMFVEQGVAAEVEPQSSGQEESEEMKILRAKYGMKN